MTLVKLPYLKEYRDRHGRVRRYVRRRGRKDVPIPGLPGSSEFNEAYQAAIAGAGRVYAPRRAPGSIAGLIADFQASPKFANLKPNTKKIYGLVLSTFGGAHGRRLVRDMPTEKAVKIIQDIGAAKPGMANLTRAVLHRLMQHAIKRQLRGNNPFAAVDLYKIGTRHTWTDEQLLIYERRWPLGTRERLAYALLFYTDQRGGDVVKWRRQDIRGGAIRFVQEKTGLQMTMPIHPALARAIKAGPTNGMNILGDENGRPVKRNHLTRLVKRAAKEAGLPLECLPHGLRKAAQRVLAERGASSKELQAVAGHATLKETERYTKDADQARLAQAIMLLPDEG